MALSGLAPKTSVPFWVRGIDRVIVDVEGFRTTVAVLLNQRWNNKLTRAQLGNPWQRYLIDGQQLPGVWSMKKMKRKLQAQSNKKSGADGGSATIRGLVNTQFELEGELYTPDHLQQWLQVLSVIDVIAKDTRTRNQHLFEHPLATLCAVSSVLILELEYRVPEQGGPLGVTLGLLSTGGKDGQTKKPQKKPVPTAAPAPQASKDGVPVVKGTIGTGNVVNTMPSFILPPEPKR